MGLDAIVSLVSLFGPKLINLATGMFHKKDSPEQTMAAMAQTNPAGLTAYVNAQVELIKARMSQFNQDIAGQAPMWLVAWRGSIRPGIVCIAFLHITGVLIVMGPEGLSKIPEWMRYQYEVAVSSWFGDRWK